MLPLSLYLLSFILCFDSDRWYNRWLFIRLGAVALPPWLMRFRRRATLSNLKLALAFFCSALFVLFMVCHGELARRRPAPAYLTSFYLMVSVGGAIGGLLIGFAAPYFLNGLYDLPIVVSLTGFHAGLSAVAGTRQRQASRRHRRSFLDAPYDKVVIGVLITALLGYIAVRLVAAKTGSLCSCTTAFLHSRCDARVMLGDRRRDCAVRALARARRD